MKRTLLLFCILLLALDSTAQSVKLKINEGLPSNKAELKENMEREAGKLLTEFNATAKSKRTLNVVDINMTDECKSDLKEKYDFLPFQCDDPVYTEPCIKTHSGYCVRNILVSILPQPDYNDALERELTINFSTNGQITNVAFSLPSHESKLILQNAKDVEDLANRNEILCFVEKYRSFYDKKDIEGLENIFDEDVIIIPGPTIVKKKTEFRMLKDDVTHCYPQPLDFYNIFKNNKFVSVKFDDIDLIRHPIRSDIYLLSMHQELSSDKVYKDGSYVTFLWHFPKDGNPQIVFRSWQSDEAVGGDKDNAINLDDLNINSIQ